MNKSRLALGPDFLSGKFITASTVVRDRDYAFRRANLLDLPFVFNLVYEGSREGSFSDRMLSATGYVYILRLLLSDVLSLPHFIKPKTSDSQLFIFELNQEAIGFIQIISDQSKAGLPQKTISMCSIAHAYRDQQHGTQMIRMFMETVPDGTEVIGYCTKYARRMQSVFKKLKFKKDKATFYRLACYRFAKGAEMLPDNRQLSLPPRGQKTNRCKPAA
ncbi:hypothetical protein [Paraherbaspirillum soli]|uniref:N-acetyltransferase domain-containing protein n=1 Tax=Paraherbaspirillum soli TaxID=631222 RepID=A0ABW0MEC0_9BURK